MNYLLHRQRSPGAVIPIPEELEELMGEISREVLRKQPPNVIHFLADYLEEKLARRENARIAEKIVDNVLDFSLDIVAMLESVGIDSARAEQAVKRIRDEFHRHFETKPDSERLRETFRERDVLERLVKECHFSEQEARKASRIIEHAYQTFYFRNAYKEPHPVGKDKDWRQAAKHTLGLYAQTGPTKEEMEVAARRIQVAYRAYYTRKRQELDRSARIIQRAVRNHRSRRLEEADMLGVPSVVLAHEIIDDDDLSYTPSEDIHHLIDLRSNPRRFQLARKQTLPRTSTKSLTKKPVVDETQAAILLQSTARGHLARKRIQSEKEKHQMATMLQSHARGYLARKKQLPRNDPQSDPKP
uniref:RIIa domain-containing protein n=1 Tax=Anopheles stephensi TaxID=30069 RepID=A0A182YHQ3_ANOST